MKARHTIGRIAVLMSTMLLVGAGEAAAQLCADVPVRPNRPALAGAISLGENSTSYGLAIQATPANHLVLDGGYSAADVEGMDVSHAVQAGAEYQRPLGTGLICPWAALKYAQVMDEGDWGDLASITAIIGATIGKEVYTNGRFRLAPFVRANYGFGSPISRMTDDGWSDSYGASGGALVFLTDRFFGVGTVSVSEGGNTGASIRLGWLLR